MSDTATEINELQDSLQKAVEPDTRHDNMRIVLNGEIRYVTPEKEYLKKDIYMDEDGQVHCLRVTDDTHIASVYYTYNKAGALIGETKVRQEILPDNFVPADYGDNDDKIIQVRSQS